MYFDSIKDLPETHYCNFCEDEKPVEKFIIVRHKKSGRLNLRRKCKPCNNEEEKGKNREYKRQYMRRWRNENKQLARSYWDNPVQKAKMAKNAAWYWKKDHFAILIQGRFARRKQNISLIKARELLKKYGRCYPTNLGLTKLGLKECERIRSRMRRRGTRDISNHDIRLMVYEDGNSKFIIPPDKQPYPYKKASERLKKWHQRTNKNKILGE